MSVEIKGLSSLQHKLRGLPASVERVVIDEVQEAGVRIRDRARELAPEDTGDLKAGIKKRREAKGLNAKVSVVGSGGRGKLFYARFIEFGSKAHVIEPRRKKALAGDGFGPAKKAVHPGTKATPFMAPAYQEVTRGFPARLSDVIRAELKRVARR